MSSPKSGQGWSTHWCSWHFQDWSHEKTFQGCGQCCSSGNFWGHDLFIIEISSCCFKIAQIDFQTHLFWVHSFCLRPYGPRQYCPNSVTQCWPRIPRFVASSLIYRRTTSIPWPLSHYLKHIFEVNLRPGDKENKNGFILFCPTWPGHTLMPPRNSIHIRSVKALETDLVTLENKYNLCSEHLAQGETVDFSKECPSTHWTLPWSFTIINF